MVEYLFSAMNYNELDDVQYHHIDYKYSYYKQSSDYKTAFQFYYDDKKDEMAEYLRNNSSCYVTDDLVYTHIRNDWSQMDSIDKEHYYILENEDKECSRYAESEYITDFYNKLHSATDIVTYTTTLDDRFRFGYSRDLELYFYYYVHDTSLYIHHGYENTIDGIYKSIMSLLRDENECDCDKCNQKYLNDISIETLINYIKELLS